MEKNIEKAFDFASDLAKQLITLSTAVIGITVTFYKYVFMDVNPANKCFIIWAWIAFFVSIICGIWVLMALTGTLDQTNKTQTVSLSIRNNNVTIPAVMQIITFLFAVGFTVIFAIMAIQ